MNNICYLISSKMFMVTKPIPKCPSNHSQHEGNLQKLSLAMIYKTCKIDNIILSIFLGLYCI